MIRCKNAINTIYDYIVSTHIIFPCYMTYEFSVKIENKPLDNYSEFLCNIKAIVFVKKKTLFFVNAV